MTALCGLIFLCPLLQAAPPEATGSHPQPLFSRHVVPLFTKLGCNAGACHGAVQGQNGFGLSLFGADPALDYERLVREQGGRRLNRSDPDVSLYLLMATGRVSHMGGRKTRLDSPEYQILRQWGPAHWPRCNSALLAGAGIKGGTVDGASDAQGGFVKDRPVTLETFGASLFHALGIPPSTPLEPNNPSSRISEEEALDQLLEG